MVLWFARVVGVRQSAEAHGQFPARERNRGFLGPCRSTSGGEGDEAPSDNSEGKTDAFLTKRVFRVVNAITELTEIVDKACLAVSPLQGFVMIIRLQHITILELGASAALLEQPLQQKRTNATKKVVV